MREQYAELIAENVKRFEKEHPTQATCNVRIADERHTFFCALEKRHQGEHKHI